MSDKYVAGGTPTTATLEFHGFEIPTDLIALTGGGPDTFEVISRMHIQNLNSQHPLVPGLDVLELGCGVGRDAIPIAEVIGPEGSYVGVDIMGPSIDWCRRHITPRYPNVTFHHDDVRDSLHNPNGTVDYREVTLPPSDGSTDLAFAQSVFTHMLRDQFIHYLREFARCIRPDGTIYATCFRVNDEILATARETSLTSYDLRFEHEIDDGCYVNELTHLTSAVAYIEEELLDIVGAAGLRMRGPIRPGAWSGYYPIAFDGQDVLVLEPRS